jgi:hypothetical protein
MRRLLAGGLGLTLGVFVGAGQAQETRSSVPAAVLLPPTAATAPAPAAALGRPVLGGGTSGAFALDRASGSDSIRPASWSSSSQEPVYRAQTADLPQPLPLGSTGGTEVVQDKEKSPEPRVIARKGNDSAPVVSSAPGLGTLPYNCWGCGDAPPSAGLDCGGPSCLPECCCGPDLCRPYRFWVNGEYLLWWIKDGSGPPLVTASPAGTPAKFAGVIGQDNTRILFSGKDLEYDDRSGGRFSGGVWFDPAMCFGLDGSFFFLGQRTASFTAGSTGDPTLARPFINQTPGFPVGQASELVSFPGALNGTVVVQSTSRLWGADTNFRLNLHNGRCDSLCDDCHGDLCFRWNALAGFRFLQLSENLAISEDLVATTPEFLGAHIGVLDTFDTRNRFYGGQIGTEAELQWRRWSLDLLVKVALGNTHEVAFVNGSTSFLFPGATAPSTFPGGLYALPTNSGRFSQNVFTVVPELGVKLAFNVTPGLRIYVGYSFLYWSSVARPGNQIDRNLNLTQQPSNLGPGVVTLPIRPIFQFRDTDFWAQGVSFGLEYRY